MTGLQAVTAVATYINAATPSVFGSNNEQKGKVFKYEKEKGYNGEYIAVNNLPFVHNNPAQVNTINVNVHVPQLPSEQPNSKRLTEIVNEVIALFDSEDGAYISGAYFKYFSDGRPTPDKDSTYYVNIQLDCTSKNI